MIRRIRYLRVVARSPDLQRVRVTRYGPHHIVGLLHLRITSTERRSAMGLHLLHGFALTVLSVFVIGAASPSLAQQPIRIGASMALTLSLIHI